MMFCQKCGAELDKNARFCTKCGQKRIMMSNNDQINENQYSSPSNTYKSGSELTEILSRLVGPINEITRLASKADAVSRGITSLEKKDRVDNPEQRTVFAILIAIPVGAIAGLYAWYCVALGIMVFTGETWVREHFGIISLLISMVACVILCAIISRRILDGMHESRKKTIQKSKDNYNEIIMQVNSICSGLDQNEVALIPPDYRYGHAVEFFYKALLNQRAVNMQQAVNLYEDTLHKERMESLQVQQANYMRSIRTTSAISAAANTANFLYKLF